MHDLITAILKNFGETTYSKGQLSHLAIIYAQTVPGYARIGIKERWPKHSWYMLRQYKTFLGSVGNWRGVRSPSDYTNDIDRKLPSHTFASTFTNNYHGVDCDLYLFVPQFTLFKNAFANFFPSARLCSSAGVNMRQHGDFDTGVRFLVHAVLKFEVG